MNDKPIDAMSFEEAMAEFEKVVSQLESGNVPLDQSIALSERGAALRARCEEALKAAEEKIETILQDSEGRATGTAPADKM